jgi:3-dehydroquinate synthase
MTAEPTATPAASERLAVALGERSYEIVVGSGVLDHAGASLGALLASPRVVIVTDTTVDYLYSARLTRSLDDAGIAWRTEVLPVGEGTKDFRHLSGLCERILAGGIDRGTTLIALGGGVIGDITGFAAGILLRGLDFVQVPTTLLAQVDSSVGGKTGINTPQGKNLVGLFHQPRLVLADTTTLDTLDARQLRAGYAEVVKYGLIDDPAFFAWLEANGSALLAGDAAARRHAIVTSCASKARIVGLDEREAGVRALLNLGHTFGHALEAETGFGDALLHGEAVAAGMALAFDLSARLGLCAAADASRVRAHLIAAGLPAGFAALPRRAWDADVLLDHMTRDKKVRDGKLTFVLAFGIGKAFTARDVPAAAVVAALSDAITAA